ncbi:hypothetical protein QBC43DRAFT_55976 [Cladorrhinum sp. PSN259]|nr:hypothetical protein QBC43DRAFT_55976 [Cladorrhinum sp. PSN259]
MPVSKREVTKNSCFSLHNRAKALKTKLMQWGYTKNVKRAEVLHILREKESRESAGKQSSFTLRQRPVALEKVTKHSQRARLTTTRSNANMQPARESDLDVRHQIACRTPPPPQLPSTLPPHQHWVVSEKILFHVDALVKGSFEAGLWRFNGNDAIIHSSTAQDVECARLHSFLSSLADGSAAAASGNFSRAGSHWRRAFLTVEALVVEGEYHDIIPNMVQKINDLNRQGLPEVAALLKTHVARCGRGVSGSKNKAVSTIYQELGRLEMAYMEDVEDRIMQRFSELFLLYLGPGCYNSFVMSMNRARRRLARHPWTTFADYLPDIGELNHRFGYADRRSLDVLGLRTEILSERPGCEAQVEAEATEMVERVAGIPEQDDWQRLYNLVRAWFSIGQAQYRFGKREAAFASLSTALKFDEEFRRVELNDIYEPERAIINEYLGRLREGAGSAPEVLVCESNGAARLVDPDRNAGSSLP